MSSNISTYLKSFAQEPCPRIGLSKTAREDTWISGLPARRSPPVSACSSFLATASSPIRPADVTNLTKLNAAQPPPKANPRKNTSTQGSSSARKESQPANLLRNNWKNQSHRDQQE